MSKKRWEYDFADAETGAEALDVLARVGYEGWEVVSMLRGNNDKFLFLLKRKFRGKRAKPLSLETYSIDTRTTAQGETQ